MFKTGTRKYLINYSVIVNGEEYPRQVTITSHNADHAKATLASRMSSDTEYVITSVQRV